MTAMQDYLAAAPADYRAHERHVLRRKASTYERKPMDLFRWTYPGTRQAVRLVVACPQEPEATRALCRAIYADLQTARAMPDFYQRKAARVRVLRELFACECWRYRRQCVALEKELESCATTAKN